MNDPVRERMHQGLATAADPQPWRCVKCGVAIRLNMNDPCKCIPVPGLRFVEPKP
jgi:hypothetical protein